MPPKRLFFSLAFTERPPFLPTFTQWPPIFDKNSLSLKDPDTSLLIKDPSFSHLIVKQVTIFGKKLDFSKKFWQIWQNVEKFLAILALKAPIFWCISLKDPLFWGALSLKDPLFWRNLSPKDPYIWGVWWHLYVTFICECPPGVVLWRSLRCRLVLSHRNVFVFPCARDCLIFAHWGHSLCSKMLKFEKKSCQFFDTQCLSFQMVLVTVKYHAVEALFLPNVLPFEKLGSNAMSALYTPNVNTRSHFWVQSLY